MSDDVVVGAGIIGLATAWHLARAGRRVVVVERHPRAQSASIRNFGMLWPIGQPAGRRRTLALRSREHWWTVLHEAGIWHERVGSLHLAYHADEVAVLQEFKEAAGAGFACEMLQPSAVAERAPRVRRDGLLGALWSPHETVVDPRDVVARLPGWLTQVMGVRFEFGALACEWDGATLHTSTGDVRADRCFICSGDELQVLFPAALADLGLRRCKLQMMRTRPIGERLGPMLAAGLTLIHYDAFASCPSRPALARRFASEFAEYVRLGIHVMASQTESGELTLGDSHEYDDEVTPFDRQAIDGLVLDYLGRFFVMSGIEIASRWHGIYVKHRTEPFCVLHPAPGATAIVGFGGAGMTLSFGATEEALNMQ